MMDFNLNKFPDCPAFWFLYLCLTLVINLKWIRFFLNTGSNTILMTTSATSSLYLAMFFEEYFIIYVCPVAYTARALSASNLIPFSIQFFFLTCGYIVGLHELLAFSKAPGLKAFRSLKLYGKGGLR